MDERKRDSMVAYLRRRNEALGIKPDDLAPAIASDQSTLAGALYRSATGDTWNDEGEMPRWLKQSTSAGQAIEHLEESSKGAFTIRSPRAGVDWRDDPIAGSLLVPSQGQ